MAVVVGDSAVAGLRVGDGEASALYVGDGLAWSAGGGRSSLSDYTLAELSEVSADLTANGTSSAYYQEFYGYLGQEYDFGEFLRNTTNMSPYTDVAQDNRIVAQLVGICHDYLAGDEALVYKSAATVIASNPDRAGLTFICKHALSRAYRMRNDVSYSNKNSGGWQNALLREYLNSDASNSGYVYKYLPQSLRDAAVPVLKLTNNTGNTSDVSKATATSDRFWVASLVEMYGYYDSSTVYGCEGTQYEWFADCDVTFSTYSALAGRNTTNSGAAVSRRDAIQGEGYSYCWLRSPRNISTYGFRTVMSSGNNNFADSYFSCCVNLGFCL